MLFWEGPNILNGHLSLGGSDGYASRLVLEPLADFDNDGNLVPILAAEVPTIANGGVAADGTSVTWKLKPGVVWSDGTPLTADDIQFTYQYVTNTATAASTAGYYAPIQSVDVVDDLTARLNFKGPTPSWFSAFVGTPVVPKHILASFVGAAAKNAPFNLKPIGTGPFVVQDFVPGDHADFVFNPRYREPGKPYFGQLLFKGGGDATSAARAVLQTGEVDYSWNLQVPANVLKPMESSKIGHLVTVPFNGAEMLFINFSDPNKTVDGQRSHLGTPHPFQTDLRVRQAYALAVQRDVIANSLYGPGGTATANAFVSPSRIVSHNTSWEYNLTKAAALLDQAGWKKGSDGIRAKNGVKMQITYATSTNALRQQEQEIIKASFESLGIQVTLKSVDASVYFSSSPGNDDTYGHFYYDVEMHTSTDDSPYPVGFAQNWYGAISNIAQKSNGWSGLNISRWQNADYDKAYQQALTEVDPSKQPALFITMNDLVVNQVAVVPMVARNLVNGVANSIRNMTPSSCAGSTWDVANWTRG